MTRWCTTGRNTFGEHWEVDRECQLIRPEIVEMFDDLEWITEDLIPGLYNWRQWGPKARPAFVSHVQHLLMLRLASRADYPKHYPPYGATLDVIHRATRERDSLLYPHVTPDYQLSLLQEVIADFLMDFLNPNHRIIHLRCPELVGASLGEETRFLTYDIHFSTSIAHAYPVLEQELAEGRKIYDAWFPRRDA